MRSVNELDAGDCGDDQPIHKAAFFARRENSAEYRWHEFSDTMRLMMNPTETKTVYLMRGLPGCGKSHRSMRLAGENGVVLETDEYFYTQVGSDPESYDYDKELLPAARQWNLERMRVALQDNVSPIIIDRGNGLNSETQDFAAMAVKYGYSIELAEPDSPWWQELRVLLKYKEFVDDKLFEAWAKRLSDSTRAGHRVPSDTIRNWMKHWRHDLTVEQILAWKDE